MKLFRNIVRAGLLASVILAVGLPASAQEFSESHMNLAREAATNSPLAREFDQVLPMLAQRIQDRFLRTRPDLQVVISETVQNVAAQLVARRNDLDNAVALVWARAFTEDELQQIANFYKSPAGQKFMDVSGTLGQGTVQAVQNWSNRVGEELLDKSREELKSQGHEF